MLARSTPVNLTETRCVHQNERAQPVGDQFLCRAGHGRRSGCVPPLKQVEKRAFAGIHRSDDGQNACWPPLRTCSRMSDQSRDAMKALQILDRGRCLHMADSLCGRICLARLTAGLHIGLCRVLRPMGHKDGVIFVAARAFPRATRFNYVLSTACTPTVGHNAISALYSSGAPPLGKRRKPEPSRRLTTGARHEPFYHRMICRGTVAKKCRI